MRGLRVSLPVGGGHGRLLTEFLHRRPRARGIVLDLPHAQAGAAAHLASQQRSDRAAFMAGDFFESVPAADVLLTKAILHDWDDAHGARILACCRQALAGGGFAIASIQPLVLDLGLIDCRLA